MFPHIFCYFRFHPIPTNPLSNKKMVGTGKKTSSIPEWFRERNVLVTGGTGFMGKVLLAKLLMSCPDIGAIYVLIRDKKGVPSTSRLTDLLQVC